MNGLLLHLCLHGAYKSYKSAIKKLMKNVLGPVSDLEKSPEKALHTVFVCICTVFFFPENRIPPVLFVL